MRIAGRKASLMALVFVISLVGVLTVHLIAAQLIWRSSPPDVIRPQLVKLSLFSTAAWIGVPVLFTIAGALSDPLGFVIAPLASGNASSVDGRVFALTFGL